MYSYSLKTNILTTFCEDGSKKDLNLSEKIYYLSYEEKEDGDWKWVVGEGEAISLENRGKHNFIVLKTFYGTLKYTPHLCANDVKDLDPDLVPESYLLGLMGIPEVGEVA